jgi:HNH endonuclease
MATPSILNFRDQIAWSYANLARAHAAVADQRTIYSRTDHMIRARLFKGLQTGRMSIASLYEDERAKLLTQPQCAYCDSTEHLSADHLIPRSKGGPDDGMNLVIACRPCNSSKRDTDMLIWLERRDVFPRLLTLRRYIKLVARHCETNDLLNLPLPSEYKNLPFEISRLPTVFPSLASLQL